MNAIEIRTLETPSLGDRSYLVHDGQVALVIDPQRDIDRVLDLAAQEGVRITHVFETHIHNDYVTGGLALAERVGATYHVNADDDVSFERTEIRDGDEIAVGDRMSVRAIHTPGHTFTHLSYAVEADGRPLAVFTGGSLLYGATGRPDLLGPEHTEELTRLQHGSAQRLAELPEETGVYPTHGFGSFCAAGSSDDQPDESTIGREKQANPALTESEEAYVRQIIEGLDVYPAYYAQMGPANAAGPAAPTLTPPSPADAEELRRRLEAGEWLVDLRTRTAFAAGHVPGTFNIGVDGQFSTYVGWMMRWGTPITLLGESEEQVAEAQRELFRIGIDPTAQATGKPESWTTGELGSFPVATFGDLADVRHHREVLVLDVRRASEYDEEHIEGAVNIPIHEFADRVHEVPEAEVWVHCASGYRSSIAASFLAAAGREVVLVDDEYDKAADAGLPITT
jgi:hydroxyacylglutathione hydrolase